MTEQSGSLKSFCQKYAVQLLGVSLFLSVNALFVVKYAPRYIDYPLMSLFLYLTSCIGIIFITRKFLLKIPKRLLQIIYFILAMGMSIGILVIQHSVDPMLIAVDRWSAIHNFLQAMLDGQYPYLAKTHLGGYGSPFPFWQFYHLPFFLLGDVGLGMLFTFVLAVFSLKHLMSSYKEAINFLILIFLSPAFWYEVLVRSDIFYNFLLLFVVISFVYKCKLTISSNLLLLALILGLMFSSRLTVIIPVAILLLPEFLKVKLNKKVFFVLVTGVIFALTFAPLLFWDANALLFFKFNPFVLQTRQGSLYSIVALLLLVLVFAFIWKKNFVAYNLYTSVVLISFVSVTLIHRMINDGFANGLFSSNYDITYFNMALPFLVYSLSVKNSK